MHDKHHPVQLFKFKDGEDIDLPIVAAQVVLRETVYCSLNVRDPSVNAVANIYAAPAQPRHISRRRRQNDADEDEDYTIPRNTGTKKKTNRMF